MHVAKIERRYKGKVYASYLLRRSVRDGPRVRHQTLGNLSRLPLPVIDLVRRSLQGEAFLAPGDSFEIVRSLPHGHVAAVLGALRKSGLEEVIASRRSRERDLVLAMVVARVLDPKSKLATARGLDPETATTSLHEVLDLGAASAEDLYGALDWLLSRQDRIEQALAKRHLAEGTLVLYDVSSTWMEGRHCPLAKLGHARDGKKGKLQIVFGLLCNREGCPVAIEVFEGNTGDPKTLASQVKKVCERFGLARVVFVGDRGMLTEARIEEDLRESGLDWITALRAPAIQRLVRQGALDLSLFDEKGLAEITSPDYPGERLVVCRNPLLADDRARKRIELLDATERDLEKVAAATRRKRRPLRGKDEIGLRVGKVLGRFRVAKHFDVRIAEDGFTFERRADRIAQEAALDGFYVIRTNVEERALAADEAVGAYKSLAAVERAFRSLKTVDLRVRPIFHRKEDRVRAHVFLCMLAYHVEWHMRRALRTMLHDEEDPAAATAARESIVAPAQRSAQTLRKVHDQRTGDGHPAHSFRTLLADLATLCRNRVRLRGGGQQDFDMLTRPTALQQRAFELLGVPVTP
jgi:hypothetical protein